MNYRLLGMALVIGLVVVSGCIDGGEPEAESGPQGEDLELDPEEQEQQEEELEPDPEQQEDLEDEPL